MTQPYYVRRGSPPGIGPARSDEAEAHGPPDWGNYRELLTPLLTAGGGQGFCVNLSVDTGSVDIMELCRSLDCFYIGLAEQLAPSGAKITTDHQGDQFVVHVQLASADAKPGVGQ